MSANRERVQVVRTPTVTAQISPEQRFWKGFTNSQLVKEHNAITHINFDPNSPHDFAITSSTRVQVFSSKTRKVVNNFTRFKDTVYCGEFRHDGKLLVAGDASGLVQIFDAHHPRTLLVTITPSSHPTHITKFHPTINTNLLTCSDDRVARIYDISQSQKPIISFNNHDDYIRSGTFLENSPNLIATGCYDNFIRIFDTRIGNNDPIIKFNQSSPVEDLLSINSTSIVSAGEGVIKQWDLIAGKMSRSLHSFNKTVTCLSSAGERGILVGSIDGHVKVFDTSTTNWDVKFGWKFGSGVLSCGVSPDFKHLVVGLNSGLLTIRTKKNSLNDDKIDINAINNTNSKKNSNKSHAFDRNTKGSDFKGEGEHYVIDEKVKYKKLQPFEKNLNAFRWSDALNSALEDGLEKEFTVTCLEELKKKGKIHNALSNRDETSLEPLLTWCVKSIKDVRNVSIINDYIISILEMYDELISRKPVLGELILNLQKKIDIEIKKAQDAERIIGMLELINA
ncbi:snoRNA-binding rRNA-processing protein [Pichia kluyveri]|uniref:SnoRNA-binding rRNA-processing protein n=1 Tax=Pichia kluyveri TaxID=36015 RepID=A0AAV5R6T7_PICKL|nr:snoRNA-binding rRNA-processing protein [Pichia kluyveri]